MRTRRSKAAFLTTVVIAWGLSVWAYRAYRR